ncbi:DNA cytosine methyltransferase [Henriciella pelagia]|jgi:DNA (cytosine-5)-methyltransferase 1|uniref:DNA cytosine methyltransferase n=1 Tax=Henriciella pelagia TaxID=1977912 RepID=UPI000A0712B3|nr:DNA cytosine methyltransferase [Henriciella pelagia]
MLNFYEFFCGGGMARAGFGSKWNCVFANDFDIKKCETYLRNYPNDGTLVHGDIRDVSTSQFSETANVAWASFPCQDLSLAGSGAGLKGDRSGTFWPFWKLMCDLTDEGRAPEIIALENVAGTLTSHEGKDFAAICDAYRSIGYQVGAVVIDASLFVPQSRPRLFVIGVRHNVDVPQNLIRSEPDPRFHTKALQRAVERLPAESKNKWVWWNLPNPPEMKADLNSIIEGSLQNSEWFDQTQTDKLLSMMSERNIAKVRACQESGKRCVGTVYKRTRRDEFGRKVQRAEVRFDGVAGCLRTPAGGSSRQLVIVVDGDEIGIRLISARETARLMGLPDSYILPEKYNESYHLTGDGVVVPVVNFLVKSIFEDTLQPYLSADKKAA